MAGKNRKHPDSNDELMVAEASNNLPETAESKEDRFIRLLPLCDSISDAALKAGYSKSFATSGIYLKLKKPCMQKKLRDFYIENAHLSIPKLSKIQNKILDYLDTGDNFKELPKFHHTQRQLLQVAGLLGQDEAPRQPVINIKDIRQLSIQVQQKKLGNPGTDQAEVVDGEFEETS